MAVCLRPVCRRLVRAAVAVAGVCIGGVAAEAGEVLVSPTEVIINPRNPTELLNLTNQGGDTLRYEINTFVWQQTADGGIVLNKTEDVVVFPLLLTLGPHETKRLRFGLQSPPGDVEKSYRVILQELPSETAGNAVSIRLVAKISLPIFVTPASAHPDPRIGSISAAGNAVSFSVLNPGTAHFMVRRLRAIATDAAGRGVFDVTTQGWYVLAGGQRDYRLTLAEADCRRVAHLVIEAETDVTPARAEAAVSCSGAGAGARTEFVRSAGAAQSGTP